MPLVLLKSVTRHNKIQNRYIFPRSRNTVYLNT